MPEQRPCVASLFLVGIDCCCMNRMALGRDVVSISFREQIECRMVQVCLTNRIIPLILCQTIELIWKLQLDLSFKY